jgi:integrase
MDRDITARKLHKGFNLVKIPSKKHGFLYYVRYRHLGQLLPSKWNTHTNILHEAEFFARQNRERIISEYLENHRYTDRMYDILSACYKKDSQYLLINEKRNRVLSEKTRSIYCHFMEKVFIPFLKDKGVKCFANITPPVIAEFQNFLLNKGNKPQSVNRYLGSIKCIFSHLVMNGVIKSNVFQQVEMVRVKRENYRVRGCYEVEQVRGVFDSPWDDTLSYLLSLMIYSTGMRNGEIEQLRMRDILLIDNCRFIDVKKSKTKNGIRLIPVHEFVYRELSRYAAETGKTADDYLFSRNGNHNQSTVYRKANRVMGGKMGKTEAELNDMGISFYSGRHYWKTLMNAGELGEDIEEYFMGHKVSKDVSSLYNHTDRQGKKRLAVKARKIFSILDKCLFRKKKRAEK